jgi:hypothetical protein
MVAHAHNIIRRQWQKDYKFEASLVFIGRHCQKKKRREAGRD